MPNSKIPACAGMNRYLWHNLGNDAGDDALMDSKNYGGLTPIIPMGESATFLQAIDEQANVASYPYIVYRWYTNGFDANSWYKPTDTVTYQVYCLDVNLLNAVVVKIVQLFKQFDLSAQSVNRYVQANLSGDYLKYSYNWISVAAATGGLPQTLENDPYTATITVRANYINDDNDVALP